jgi:hypothetical protein
METKTAAELVMHGGWMRPMAGSLCASQAAPSVFASNISDAVSEEPEAKFANRAK